MTRERLTLVGYLLLDDIRNCDNQFFGINNRDVTVTGS